MRRARRPAVRSFTTSTAPSADSLFQSCRSFFPVEPDRLRSAASLRNGRVCSDTLSSGRPPIALIIARNDSASPSSSFNSTTFGRLRAFAIASKNAGITAFACFGSITGLAMNAYS